ncbi:WD40-repeat-containing domain protein [Quillaja saponaria]|uniref:WD40-repeat-containing domain protein n=1 Tax=Quillaja saponaria TaxID=32244 RepID=A0AAD7LIN8_QUISA|nr:WD40-repeat-containing domain protein [Quillaja saponaria]
MADLQKGKLFMFCLLFVFASPYVRSFLVKSESSLIQYDNELNQYHQPESEPKPTNDLNHHVLFIHQLQELVRNLSEIVSRLESKLREPSKVAPVREKSRIQEKDKIGQRKYDDRRSLEEIQEEGFEGKIRKGERAKGVLVTKYSPFWSERFQFVSAVKLDSDATCVHVLPFRDYEGLSKYVAVGDERGRVYVFLRNGDVLVEFYTLSESPITAMVSYMSVYKNESVLVTGHRNGAILMHRIWEGLSGEDWSSLVMENVVKFVAPDLSEEDGSPITILEVHLVGRMRYILSTDLGGKISVFRETGIVYGSAMPRSKPLAFLKQRLMFLTETGAGSLDLRSMKLRESECEGLNRSLARNYVFDAAERSKAYGFTSEGDLIHLLLLGDLMNFKCRVRSKRKFDMDEPLVLQAIKGYLLIVSEEKVFLLNVSSQHYVRVGASSASFLFKSR